MNHFCAMSMNRLSFVAIARMRAGPDTRHCLPGVGASVVKPSSPASCPGSPPWRGRRWRAGSAPTGFLPLARGASAAPVPRQRPHRSWARPPAAGRSRDVALGSRARGARKATPSPLQWGCESAGAGRPGWRMPRSRALGKQAAARGIQIVVWAAGMGPSRWRMRRACRRAC